MNRPVSEKKMIRDFKKIADFSLPPGNVERDLAALRRRLECQDVSRTAAGRKVWKMIMESKATKYVSAAMVFIGVFIGLYLFPTAEVSAAELLRRVSKSMSKYTWIKSVTESFLPCTETPASVQTSYSNIRDRQVYLVYDAGYLHHLDYANNRWSVYRPEDNSMIVQELKGRWQDAGGQVEPFVAQLSREGLVIRQTEDEEDGSSITLIEYDEVLNNISPEPGRFMSAMMMGGKTVKTIKTRLKINRERLILSTSEMSYFDPEDRLIVTDRTRSEPVDSGPADIYELGAPADVNVINKIPDHRVREIREIIDKKQDAFLDSYLAVQLENIVRDGNEEMIEAMVIYADGNKLRVDVFGKYYSSYGHVPEDVSRLVAKSHDLLPPYLPNEEKLHLRSLRIYDGLWQHKLDYHEKKYRRPSPQRRPDGDEFGDDDIADFGWRKLWWLNEPEWMMEDDFSKENGLVGMELSVQSQFGRLPKRLALYVDPARDYLYRRYIEQELADAPWQIDKTWLDNMQNRNQLTERVRIYDVIEYGQTSAGQWYPKVTTITGYDRPLRENGRKMDFNRVSRIWLLEENPVFPEGLFDPTVLPDLKEE